MKRLTVQQRAQRWVRAQLPGNEHPYYAEAGWLAGYKAGQRDTQRRLGERIIALIQGRAEEFKELEAMVRALQQANAVLHAKARQARQP